MSESRITRVAMFVGSVLPPRIILRLGLDATGAFGQRRLFASADMGLSSPRMAILAP